jgi:hypothetical protein
MLLRFFFTLVLSSAVASIALGQSFDPYRALNDPLAIADLGDPDSGSSHHVAFVHMGYDLQADGYRMFASMQGKGVVSHLWMTQGLEFDPALLIKIYVDDSLVFNGRVVDFFFQQKPPFESTFIRKESGGLVCDLQIPYLRNFKVTSKGEGSFFALSWRDLEGFDSAKSFNDLDPLDKLHLEAESNFRNASMNSGEVEVAESAQEIQSGKSVTIFSAEGAAVIRSLQFLPADEYNPATYRDLWLQCFWDGSPYPAIDVPLADFFGAAYQLPEIRAMQMKVGKAYGLLSELPMPYRSGARVKVVNRGTSTAKLTTRIGIENRYDRQFGRLTCQFNETRFPRVKHLLPILHVKGKGRAIGVMFNMPPNIDPYFLEGNPRLLTDSNWNFHFIYPGTEDYFNGGWYFREGPFTAPFAGCPNKWTTMYRFHYLDRLNFSHVADWDWQHGVGSDYPAHYRTVSFCYLESKSFWTSADSIVSGRQLTIEGAGYGAGQLVDVILGNQSWNAMADEWGKIATNPPQMLLPGSYQLSVNGEKHRQHITVLSKPSIEVVHDSSFPEYCAFDSVEIYLRGFAPNSRVNIQISSVEVGKLLTDSRGCAWGNVKVGIRSAGTHELVAIDADGRLSSMVRISITPWLRYEIEEMDIPDAQVHFNKSYMGWWEYADWSNAFMIFADPAESGEGLAFSFDTPMADSFDVEMSLTKGLRYSNAEVVIDGRSLGVVNCFFDTLFDRPFPVARVPVDRTYLSQGTHTLSLFAHDRDPGAVGWAIGADALFLKPISSGSSVHPPIQPLVTELRISYTADGIPRYYIRPSAQPAGDCVIDLVDGLGRQIRTLYEGRIGNVMEGSIDTHQLSPGVYFLRLQNQQSGVNTVAFLIHE